MQSLVSSLAETIYFDKCTACKMQHSMIMPVIFGDIKGYEKPVRNKITTNRELNATRRFIRADLAFARFTHEKQVVCSTGVRVRVTMRDTR